MKTISLFVLLGLCCAPSQAHDFVSGQVVDAVTQIPLPGANISVAGTSWGATTGASGTFRVPMDTVDYALLVSFVGYTSQEIKGAELTSNPVVALVPSTLQLPEVMITGGASRVVAPLRTLSDVDIRLRPVNSSQDILRVVPGLFIAQHAGGGKAEQIFLRGFDIDHGTDVQINVDGLPVNMVSHAHEQGYADLHFVIPELVNAVDFGKGPYNAQYGDFATAGYVNLSTPTGLEQSMVKVEAGRFNTIRNVNLIDVSGKSDRQHAYLASELLRTDGPFESNQHFRRINLFGKYTNQLNANQWLTLQGSTFSSQWDASGQIPNRAVVRGLIGRFGSLDDTEGGATRRTNLSARLVSELAGGATLENQLYYTRYGFELFSNFTFFLEDSVNGDQIKQQEQRSIFGYQGKLQQSHTLAGLQANASLGLGFRYDQVDGIELSQTRSRRWLRYLALGDIEELSTYLYAEETLDLGRFSLNLGARLDYFSFGYRDQLDSAYQNQTTDQVIVSPKVNLSYQVNSQFQLYLNTGKGFHSNDARVVVTEPNQPTLPAAYGADLGTTWKPTPRLLVNAALWYLYLEDELVYVGDAGIVEPSGKTRRLGADLSLRYQLQDWLLIDADVNVARPRSLTGAEGERHIPLAPTLTSIGGLTVRLPGGLNGSLRYRYLDDRPANENGSVIAQGYTILDAVINYVRPSYALNLTIENLLNTEWNEAQFDTESQLRAEPAPVSEIHFTPGTPFFVKAGLSYFF